MALVIAWSKTIGTKLNFGEEFWGGSGVASEFIPENEGFRMLVGSFRHIRLFLSDCHANAARSWKSVVRFKLFVKKFTSSKNHLANQISTIDIQWKYTQARFFSLPT